jgi:hypothetical protein
LLSIFTRANSYGADSKPDKDIFGLKPAPIMILCYFRQIIQGIKGQAFMPPADTRFQIGITDTPSV